MYNVCSSIGKYNDVVQQLNMLTCNHQSSCRMQNSNYYFVDFTVCTEKIIYTSKWI